MNNITQFIADAEQKAALAGKSSQRLIAKADSILETDPARRFMAALLARKRQAARV